MGDEYRPDLEGSRSYLAGPLVTSTRDECLSGPCRGTGSGKIAGPKIVWLDETTSVYTRRAARLTLSSGMLSPPAAACSDAAKKCNAAETACVCTSDGQCGGPWHKCVNAQHQCTDGACTGEGGNYDANLCQIPPAIPSTPTTTYACTNSAIAACDGSHHCGKCTDDSQCVGGTRDCCSDLGCPFAHTDGMNCYELGDLGERPTPTLACSAGTCVDGRTCRCSNDSDCGAWSDCSATRDWGVDLFYCTRTPPVTRASCTTGTWHSGACKCQSDSQCGSNSRCVDDGQCAADACTGRSGSDRDSFNCTERTPTYCSSGPPFFCRTGAPNPAANACLCTHDNQCGSGRCAHWSGCAQGECSGMAGEGDVDNCVTTCALSTNHCSIGAPPPSGTACWCTNDSQCASGRCVPWSGCGAAPCTGTERPGSDHCEPERLFADTCHPSTCANGNETAKANGNETAKANGNETAKANAIDRRKTDRFSERARTRGLRPPRPLPGGIAPATG